MPYFPIGADDDTVPLYNATTIPGMAYARNKATEALYYDLQRQLNRVIYASPGIRGHKNSMMIEDSLIGADTVRAILVVLGKAVTVEDAAKNAEFYRNAARLVANPLGAPDSPPGVIRRAPRSSLPPAAERAATDLAPPGPGSGAGASILDSFKNLDTTTMIALAAVAVGAGYFLTRKGTAKSNPAVWQGREGRRWRRAMDEEGYPVKQFATGEVEYSFGKVSGSKSAKAARAERQRRRLKGSLPVAKARSRRGK
jgi:hypothetical protein